MKRGFIVTESVQILFYFLGFLPQSFVFWFPYHLKSVHPPVVYLLLHDGFLTIIQDKIFFHLSASSRYRNNQPEDVAYKEIFLPRELFYNLTLGQKNLKLSGRNVSMNSPPGVPTLKFKSTPLSMLSTYFLKASESGILILCT